MSKKKNAASKKPQKAQKPPKSKMLFSIRNKIVVCFLVPVVFMILIGTSAYEKASEGMSSNFVDSTSQTLQMMTGYIDMVGSFIQAEGNSYAFDTEHRKYFIGLYEDDQASKVKYYDNTRNDLLTTGTLNPFIYHIHLVTKAGINLMSSKDSQSMDGIFEQYMEEMSPDGKKLDKWVDGHPLLDEYLRIDSKDYIFSYQTIAQSNNACIVIDVKSEAIQEFLDDTDLGKGSIVGFITGGGRELVSENLEEGEEGSLAEGENVFFGQDFYQEAVDSEELIGVNEAVRYKDEDYFFIYSKCETANGTVCVLVPRELVTGQAQEIKTLTVGLVILACVIVLAIGIFIAAGIQKNMERISQKFGVMAGGDLTVQVTARGRDEFRGLAASANNMVDHTKKLVRKVSGATEQLEASSAEVEQVSGVIDEYSRNITQAIGEINEGMSRQSQHARECVAKTDTLSNEIQGVSRIVERVEKLVAETEDMINRAMEIVQLLGSRAQETTEITAKVGESIDTLRKESDVINTFVETIAGISQQTNLLSLNASIEAARAGEVGRGFAVVAEEIRKLADDSAAAAGQIGNNVGHITAQTLKSVESAKQAQTMVALQTEAVDQVVGVFQQMQERMSELVAGLNEIVVGTEKADKERSDAVEAVKNISHIIEETAGSAETVNEVADKLLEKVENLNQTAEVLGSNMEELKTEISVFKI